MTINEQLMIGGRLLPQQFRVSEMKLLATYFRTSEETILKIILNSIQ